MAKAAPKPQELNINLIQKEQVTGTPSEIIHWVLTVGRYLVIATEIVALATFGLAIKFSADKNDLKQRIKLAQSEVETKAACHSEDPEGFCEDRFRNIQNRINKIKTVRNSQFYQNQVVTEFLDLLPNGFKLKTLEVDNEKIAFTGSFATSIQLQTLITSFSDSEKITDLDIEELVSPTNTDPNFNFKASAFLNSKDFSGPTSLEIEGDSDANN
jgi:hypothetical protein